MPERGEFVNTSDSLPPSPPLPSPLLVPPSSLRRLKRSYELLTASFRSVGMKYQPACAAMFCWLDLRSLLRAVSGVTSMASCLSSAPVFFNY